MFKFYKLKPSEYFVFLLWVLIASLYIRPYNGIMEPYYKIGNYFVLFYSCYIVVRKWNLAPNTLKIIHGILVLSMMYLIISRLLNGYNYNAKLSSEFAYSISMINLFSLGLIENTWAKLKAFSFLLCVYICINLMTIISYPDGLYETDVYSNNWYLGYKNAIIRTILPGVTLNCLCSIHDYGKLSIKDYLLLFVAVFSEILVDSSTGLVMMVIFVVGILWLNLRKKFPRMSNNFSGMTLWKAFLVTGCISVAFTIFSFQSHLSSLIETLFEKDATFTGRTYVWAFSLIKIVSSPILGFGWHTEEEWRSVLGFYTMNYAMGFSHPHNFILYILLQGGIIYLSMIVFIIIYISKRIKSDNDIYIVLTLMYLTFFVEGITESLTGTIFLLPMLGIYGNLSVKEIKK